MVNRLKVFLTSYNYEVIGAVNVKGEDISNLESIRISLADGERVLSPPVKMRPGLPGALGDLRVRLTAR